MKNLLKDKRGSMIVEGAMVMPIIILISISAIFLIMEFYVLVVNETISDSKEFEEGFNEGINVRNAVAVGDIVYDEK